jgi:hypothetical protein
METLEIVWGPMYTHHFSLDVDAGQSYHLHPSVVPLVPARSVTRKEGNCWVVVAELYHPFPIKKYCSYRESRNHVACGDGPADWSRAVRVAFPYKGDGSYLDKTMQCTYAYVFTLDDQADLQG